MDDKLIFFNPILNKAYKDNKMEAISHYFQQLWQLDNLLILIGAGFSKSIGYPLMPDLSELILPNIIIDSYIKNANNQKGIAEILSEIWGIDNSLKKKLESIKKKDKDSVLPDLKKFCVTLNLEEITNKLKIIEESLIISKQNHEIISNSIKQIEKEIIKIFNSVIPNTISEDFVKLKTKLKPYKYFIKRLLKIRRPLQPRLKIFSTNYDLLIETISDLESIHCITGFEGTKLRLFNPTNFDLELNFKSTGQSSIFYNNVLHLYKLHGSIDWGIINLDGVNEIIQDSNIEEGAIIYPNSSKYSETLEMPYGEMFRRLNDNISQPQTVLFTIGYSFMDQHINQIILKALKNPSCQLIIIEPMVTEKYQDSVKSDFLKSLIKLTKSSDEDTYGEERICIIGGEASKFPDILKIILPEEQIEDPSEEVKNIISRLIKFGDNK